MEGKIVSFETAKLANEKGFDLKQDRRYVEILSPMSIFVHKIQDPNGRQLPWIQDPDSKYKVGDILCSNVYESTTGNNANQYKEYGEAPPQHILQRWIREVHNIDVIVIPYNDHCNYGYHWQRYDKRDPDNDGWCKISAQPTDGETYEEALEAGLLACLKIL
jgi:hypothetical protein